MANGDWKKVNPNWPKDMMGGDWDKFGDVWVGRVFFDTETASKILEHHNNRNRKPVDTQIELLKRDLLEGHFLFSGETIIFDWDRELINGQNRLRSCLNTDKKLETLVIVGVDPQVFKVLDQQSKRTGAQILHMMGEVSSSNLSSGITYLNQFLNNGQVIRGAGSSRKRTMTIHERIEILRLHPDLRESMKYITYTHHKASSLFPGFGLPISLHYLTANAHRNIARDFWEGLLTYSVPKEDRFKGCQLFLNRLVDNASEIAKLNTATVGGLAIKAYNAAVDNVHLKILQFREKEEYPKISGLKYEGKQIIL